LSLQFLGSKGSPPPPPPDVAHGDLMARLGLLLDGRSANQMQDSMSHGQRLANQGLDNIPEGQRLANHSRGEEMYTLTSSSNGTPDRGIADTSPMSTLTGTWENISSRS